MAYLTSARSNCRRRAKVGEITMDNELLNAKIAALEGKRPLARAMKNKPGLYCSPVLRDPAAAPSARAVRPTAPSVPGSRLLDFVPRRGFEACIRLRAPHHTFKSSGAYATAPRMRPAPYAPARAAPSASPAVAILLVHVKARRRVVGAPGVRPHSRGRYQPACGGSAYDAHVQGADITLHPVHVDELEWQMKVAVVILNPTFLVFIQLVAT